MSSHPRTLLPSTNNRATSKPSSASPALVLPAWQLPHNKQPTRRTANDTKDASLKFDINHIVDAVITESELSPQKNQPPRPTSTSPVTKRASSRSVTSPHNHFEDVMQKVAKTQEKRQLKRVKDEMKEIATKIEKIEQYTQQMQEKQQQASAIPENISSKLTEINSRVYWLDRVFFTAEERVRDTAATKICAVVRGYLVRRRFKLAKTSLQSYKERVTADVGGVILSWLAQRALLFKKSKLRQSKEMQQIGKQVFVAWYEATRGSAPFWADLREKGKKLLALHISYVARRCLREWRDTALGPHSRKAVARAYRERYKKAEQRVVMKAQNGNLRGKLDPKMVDREIKEDIVKYVMNVRNRNLTRLVLVSWHLVAIQKTRKMRNAKYAKSIRHHRHKLLKPVLEKWRETTRVSKYEHGPERWLHRKNKNVAVYQTNIQTLKSCFTAWRKTCRIRAEAQRRFMKKQTEVKQKVLVAFRARTMYEKRLKMKVIERWIRTKELFMRYAFQAWYLYTVNCRLNNTHKRMLLRAIARRKKMKSIRNCFVAWKSFVLDREKILWEQQTEVLMSEVHSLRKENAQLVSNMERFTLLVTDFENTVDAGQDELKEKEDTLRVKNEELLELKFSLHHSKQEIERLRTIIDNNGLSALVNIKKMLKTEGEEVETAQVPIRKQVPMDSIDPDHFPKSTGAIAQYLESMAEEKFFNKIGSTSSTTSHPSASLVSSPILSPRQQHKQQLEKLMNQQQKQKEEIDKLFPPSSSSSSLKPSPHVPASREEFFHQRVFVPTEASPVGLDSPNEFSVFLHDVRAGMTQVDQVLSSIPRHISHPLPPSSPLTHSHLPSPSPVTSSPLPLPPVPSPSPPTTRQKTFTVEVMAKPSRPAPIPFSKTNVSLPEAPESPLAPLTSKPSPRTDQPSRTTSAPRPRSATPPIPSHPPSSSPSSSRANSPTRSLSGLSPLPSLSSVVSSGSSSSLSPHTQSPPDRIPSSRALSRVNTQEEENEREEYEERREYKGDRESESENGDETSDVANRDNDEDEGTTYNDDEVTTYSDDEAQTTNQLVDPLGSFARHRKETSRLTLMRQSASMSLASRDPSTTVNTFSRAPSTPALLKTQSTKFTQQVESLRERINAFKMYIPMKVPSLASLSGFSTSSPPGHSKPAETVLNTLPGSRLGSPQNSSKTKPASPSKPLHHFADLHEQLHQQSHQIHQQQKQNLYHPNMEIMSSNQPSKSGQSTNDVKKRVVIQEPKQRKHV